MLRNKRIVVTGGAGFIGCNLVRALCDRNEVIVLDNLSTGRLQNLDDVCDSIKFIKESITDYTALEKSFRDVDIVFHVAALPSVAQSMVDPLSTNHVNVTGTLNVLHAAKNCGVSRVIYSSSSSVYGDAPKLPKKENMTPAPISPYGVSKLTAEYYCSVFYKAYGLYTVSLRYFNVFGPHQDPSSEYAAVIPKFIHASLSGKPMTIFGDGEQSRDFSFVQNVVDANIRAAESRKAGGAVLNIATGSRITINHLAKKIMQLTGKSVKVVHTKERKGDIKHSLADISLAAKTIGYKPAISLDKGLEITIKNLKMNF